MSNSKVLAKSKKILDDTKLNLVERLQKLVDLLNHEKDKYDWVGFYFAKHSEKTLHLVPFSGEPTDHIVIPFGKGICGQVAESNNTFLVDDVNAQGNYIACSLNVKSEIVVPIFVNNQNIGQIDIDSNTANAFSKEDEALLESINQMIAQVIEKENIQVLDLVEYK
ncbi:GAF domain-containing protein [Flavobacterium sp. CS20]|uniref:GAF domain-containing protein n=1 Tax=Flavobacterium sp. CS20 TaxID=2775246 RepID=UPI001B39E0CB|nr:GAF domain-containing protein [Flavobacterium sp. CS20]QTY26236.1 GAF domain-containing protein [Flavobacterium sp. CS20]